MTVTAGTPSLTTQYCTFHADGQTFGIAVSVVREVLQDQANTNVPAVDPVIGGLINLRGQIVMTVDLRTRLGLDPAPPDAEPPMLVVVQVEDEIVGLAVDGVGDVVSLRSDGFQPPPRTLPERSRHLISAVYRLDEGLVQVLDVTRLLPSELDED
ncbi:MAG: chemotaxis protein CheW [Acidimicrobiales bacterium]